LAGQTGGADCAGSLSDGRKAGPQHKPSGINAATRELGIERTKAQRAVKVAGKKAGTWCPGLFDHTSLIMEFRLKMFLPWCAIPTSAFQARIYR
jgi:hypothetical protein